MKILHLAVKHSVAVAVRGTISSAEHADRKFFLCTLCIGQVIESMYFLNQNSGVEDLTFLAFPSLSTSFVFSMGSKDMSHDKGFMIYLGEEDDPLAILGEHGWIL